MISTTEIQSFVSSFETRVAPVEKAFGEAWWNLATTGTEEAQEELVRAGNAYDALFADAEEFERMRGWYEERGSLQDPLLRRQVEVLYRAFAGKQGDREILRNIQELEAEANATYSNHRGVVDGREIGENEVREVLRSSGDDRLRREAWEASKTVGREVEATVRELARLRNRLAREAGYPDHYHRSLDLQEIGAADLARLMDELESVTEAPFRDLKSRLDTSVRERFGVESVMPWHLPDPFFQSCKQDPSAFPRPDSRGGSGSASGDGNGVDVDSFFRDKDLEALTRKTYDNMGLEVRDVMAKSDLYEREGKSQHAFCLGVGRDYPYDVRVLANVQPDSYWMDTMLHEFGHAVYDKHINPGLPYFLRSIAHINTTEAIALMMGSLADDPEWLSDIAGVSEAELSENREYLHGRDRADKLVFTRWALVMFHFEQALYADPGREDLNTVWWDLVERIQLVERPPDRDEPDWAAKIHVATAPVYYHNYVLGHLTAAQLRHYLETYITHGPFFESEVAGRYLLEAVFGPGARDDWQTTVLRATGEKLNPRYFVESLG
ncbi:MAG TPA: M2 family metallopeptidase [Rubrobacteraceae bacterium]|nr:M2 family metallopeptidase [Rubrobacteraceae bacterium]